MDTLTKTKKITLWQLTIILVAILASEKSIANEQVYETGLKSTVWIITKTGRGSGVLVDTEKRLVVTNHHVVDEQEKVVVYFPVFRDGRLIAEKEKYEEGNFEHAISAKIIRSDAKRDLAILKLERIPPGTTAIVLGEPATPGQEIHSIGNPGDIDALWVYSYGRVRARYYRKFQSSQARQFQALDNQIPINPGDSGGPVLNNEGQLVGINQGARLNVNLVSISVDISEIKWLLDKVNNGTALPLHSESEREKPSLRNLSVFSRD